ncbi:MAG: glycosyltransferase family 4 protein [Aphanocapsa sp. GSE-SYN-MK-11-07L]|jgi:glycosyltransferase involved in cell wall biosynthesis|nr:glycosyltransferase family 4 protein [Aphanocapsa sp. GSE-SYN-MK-11-07L]
MKVAIVHEWFVSYAGSERVVEQLLHLFPQADLFALVDFLPEQQRGFIQGRPVKTSFIQNLPWAKKHFRQYLPLMPLAIEQLDLSGYDLILSSNHAVAKGILTRADQLHLCYVHTPIRYAWDLQQQYLKGAGLDRGLKAVLASLILHYLRLWDLASAHRVDVYVANSRYVAARIQKTYRRTADVVYPPVAVNQFECDRPRQDFYLTVARFVPYKRVDLIVEAFTQLGFPLVVIGDGPNWQQVRSLAGPNIQLLGHQPDSVVKTHLETCKAFVFAAEEDFGITPVEAQAAGAPVIAYGRGGVAETVIAKQTGIFFAEQTVDSLKAAIAEFARLAWSAQQIRQQAEQFSVQRFRDQMMALIQSHWQDFQQRNDIQ